MTDLSVMTLEEKTQHFIRILSEWYRQNQRQLPFRGATDPYKIWVSEVLLQQTQVNRGVEYYERFINRFPMIGNLAEASWEEFFPYFQGLGYYNRGRNMIKTAKIIVEKYGGSFPSTKKELEALPGIGSYTADAILSFAFNKPTIPLDTNIKRILGRVFLGTSVLEEKSEGGTVLLKAFEESYQRVSSATINQAMMDFCSMVCFATKPVCMFCPLQQSCLFFKKELPYDVPKKKIASQEYDAKYPIAIIMHKQKVLLFEDALLGGLLKRGSERDFLKNLAAQRLGVELSVRAAYKTWIENGIKYSLHRCYILLGEDVIEKIQPLAIEVDEIEEYLSTCATDR
jgi:A/G-specific adenine glycosylase